MYFSALWGRLGMEHPKGVTHPRLVVNPILYKRRAKEKAAGGGPFIYGRKIPARIQEYGTLVTAVTAGTVAQTASFASTFTAAHAFTEPAARAAKSFFQAPLVALLHPVQDLLTLFRGQLLQLHPSFHNLAAQLVNLPE
jgi:hypothetical protein